MDTGKDLAAMKRNINHCMHSITNELDEFIENYEDVLKENKMLREEVTRLNRLVMMLQDNK